MTYRTILLIFFILMAFFLPPAFAEGLVMDLDTIVITPNRIREKQYQVAGDVTVISRRHIEASNARTVPEVLKETAGILIYDKGTAKTATADMRGFGDTSTRNVLVLVNGRAINTADISGPDFLQVPLGAVERIEIIRGAGSVMYGDNAVGGVINIITKKGEGDFQGRLGAVYGSYDRRGQDVEVSGKEKGVSYYGYARYMDDRGYRDNSDVLTRDFQVRLGYDPTENIRLDINTGWHRDRYGLPGGLNASELSSLGRRASADPEDFAETLDQFVQLTFDATPWRDEDYKGDLSLAYMYRDREVFDSFRSFGEYNTNRALLTHTFSGQYVYDRPIKERDVRVVLGLDYSHDENEISGSGANTDNLNIIKESFGVYGHTQYELWDDVYVNAGTRFQKAYYTFDQRASTMNYETRAPSEWVSMGGIKYNYAAGSNIHASVQQTFRFLATDEWYSTFSGLNTDLDQQTGIQYQAGVKHNFDNAAIVTGTLYWLDLKNEIFFNPDKGFFGTNDNYDKTRRVGVEVTGRADLLRWLPLDAPAWLDGLSFFANYTYQRPRFVGGANDGKDIPMAPRHQASQGFLVRFWDAFDFSLTGRYVGGRYAINDVQNATAIHKAYYVTDCSLRFARKEFEWFVNINNLFNEHYSALIVKSASGSTKDFFPAAERNFMTGIKVKF